MQDSNELFGLQLVVYEWIKENPWQKRSTAGKEIPKQYMVNSKQVYNAHATLTQKGLLRKKGASKNTTYAVKSNDELERQRFENWGSSQRCELVKWVRGDKAGQYKNPVVEKMWQAWQAALSSKQEQSDG